MTMDDLQSKPPVKRKNSLAQNNNQANFSMKSIHNFDESSASGELSPILTCIRSIQGSEALWDSENLNHFTQLSLKELKNEQILKYEDGFCFAVSLQDGSTLYVSSAITKHLGYPKDMLVGQCIMNFLYQKDHVTFANHLTQGLNACFNQGINDESHLVPNTFFCRLRVYHGLKFGYGVSDRKTVYKPFKVTLHINDLIFDDVCVEKVSSTLCVKASATPLFPAYQIPEEIPAMSSFSTRHTASCHFSHVDASAIPYLGYLPQDMIGYSVFDFYHIDDMPQLKDIYELVVKERGSSFRTKPYRFKAFNGCYITLETEWSCFINPWSRKLEFVVGQHRVLKGPTDISIFDPYEVCENIPADEILKESQIIQKEIRYMLAQPIKDCVLGKTKRFCNKRKRDLASFVYNFIDDEGKKRQGDQYSDNGSSSDSDSVVMGEISPHQDMHDSSTFSETPPTCQEIRYKENIERFFASQPKTFSDGSEECQSDKKNSVSDSLRENLDSSKQQESLPSTSSLKASDDPKQRESSGTFSKYNMSYGDSGYKSSQSIHPSSSGGTSATNNAPTWSKSDDMEKFPQCAALTEESLLQHNRLNHKYMKHRKSKGNISHVSVTQKDNNWIKHGELGKLNIASTSHKHRKCARIQTDPTSSRVSQPTEPKTSQPTFSSPFSIGNYGMPMMSAATTCTPSSQVAGPYPSFGIFPPYPYMPASCAPNAPTSPFVIPVMYMGTLPCYPTMPNMIPANGVPMWPCAPLPPHGTNGIYSGLPAGYTVPMPFVPNTPASSSTNNNSTMSPLVQPSGATATATVLTTTTTVAPGLLSPSRKGQLPAVTNLSKRFTDCRVGNEMSSAGQKTNTFNTNVKDMAMQVDNSISYSSSPSCQSENPTSIKSENMDFESKFGEKYERRIREDPFWLSGVDLTHDVVYRYKMSERNMQAVLMKDMEALRTMKQPRLVNKQLELLKNEFEVDKKTDSLDTIMLGLTTTDENDKGSLNFHNFMDSLRFTIAD